MRRLGGVLALAACSPGVRVVPPPEGITGGLVVALERPGEAAIVRATDAAGPVWVTGLEGDAELFVAGYASGLDALGLAEGPIEAPLDCGSCELASPVASYRLGGAEDSAPITSAPLSAELLDRLLPDRALRCGELCRSFDARSVTLDSALGATWLARGAGGRVLIGTGEGVVYELDPSGPTAAPRCRVQGTETVAVDEGERVWLLGPQAFFRLEPGEVSADRPCPRTELAPFPGRPRFAAIQRAGSSTDAIALTSSTTVYRYVADAWRRVAEFPDEGDNEGGAVFTGAGRAAVSNASDALLFIDGDRYTVEPLDLAGPIADVAYSESFGLVLAIEYVGIVAQRGGGWVTLDTVTGWRELSTLEIEGDRIWLMAGAGLHEYRELTGSCPALGTVGKRQVAAYLTLADGRIVHAGRDDSRSTITVLTPRVASACPR